MGSLGRCSAEKVAVLRALLRPRLVASATPAKALNAPVMGESEARSLEIDVERVKLELVHLLTAWASAPCVPGR